MSERENREELHKFIDSHLSVCPRLDGSHTINGIDGLIDEILKREQAIRKECWKEQMAELRDPNGTIWEHAKYLQDKADNLESKLKRVVELLKQHVKYYPHDNIGSKQSIDQAIKISEE